MVALLNYVEKRRCTIAGITVYDYHDYHNIRFVTQHKWSPSGKSALPASHASEHPVFDVLLTWIIVLLLTYVTELNSYQQVTNVFIYLMIINAQVREGRATWPTLARKTGKTWQEATPPGCHCCCHRHRHCHHHHYHLTTVITITAIIAMMMHHR